MARKHDLHDLARLAHDLVAGAVAPLAGGGVHGEPLRESRHDLAIHEAAPPALAHGGPRSDIAAEHQLGHLGRFLADAAVRRLGLGAAGERWREHQYRERSTEHARSPEDPYYPLMRSMA